MSVHKTHPTHQGRTHSSASPYNYFGRTHESVSRHVPHMTGTELRRGGMVKNVGKHGLRSRSDRGYGPQASYAR